MNTQPRSLLGVSLNAAAQATQRSPLARTLAFIQLLTTKTVWLVLFVGLAQLTLPEGYRPSDLIGIFHGGIEQSEILAKREAVIEFEREKARAVAREQAKVQWEMEVLRNQMQTLHESLTALGDVANGSDWVCAIGQVVTANAINSDWRKVGQTLSGACGVSAEIRVRQQREYAELSRKYEALVARKDQLGGQLSRAQ